MDLRRGKDGFEIAVPKHADGAGDSQTAGVVLNLANGDTDHAQFDPLPPGRIMEVPTAQAFGRVVDAVGRPDHRPLRQRGGG